jgi:hypothetical protein
MDETFIKMCKEATEIQERWEPKKGDMIYYVKKKLIEPVTMADKELKNRFGYHYKQMGFWLPRQEDLQKIYKEQKELSFDCCYVQFKRWDAFRYQHERFEHGLPYFEIFETGDWNILWLCFVMETCFNKQWNGTTWEAI